jgi:flagellar M-ring protein FliF
MDFLNKAFAQLNDLFRSMSPGGRITAALLLVVAVVSVGYLFQAQAGGGDEDLFGGASIEGATLQKMAAAFGHAGLNGFEIKGDRMMVPHARRAEYLAVVADAKLLPYHFGDHMMAAAEGGLIESPRQQDERRKLGRELELSEAIRRMNGIEYASVFIDSQPQTGLGQPPVKTASVVAAAVGAQPLDDEQVEKICKLVAHANAGMNPENVTIADQNGPARTWTGGDIGAADDSYARAVRTREQYWNNKIRAALAAIPNVTVTSTVVLDRETRTSESIKKIDPKTVPVQTQETSLTMSRDSNSPGGAPGLAAQSGGVNVPVPAIASNGNATSEESRNSQVNEVSTNIIDKMSDGRATKSAKVAVGIPASYYERLWLERNPTKTGEEQKKPDQTALDAIRAEITKDVITHVATLLQPLLPNVTDPTTLVTATTFQDLKPTEIPGPSVPQRVLTWLVDNWTMLGMMGLVLASVAMLRSALRGAPARATAGQSLDGQGSAAVSARIPASEAAAEEKEEAVEVTAARRLRRMTGSGPSLRDELSELVKEDPDSAASILRSWIGQAN